MLLDDKLDSKESRWAMNALKSSVEDDGDLYMDEKIVFLLLMEISIDRHSKILGKKGKKEEYSSATLKDRFSLM